MALNQRGKVVVNILALLMAAILIILLGTYFTPSRSAQGQPVSAGVQSGSGSLIISEVMHRNDSAHMDADGDFPDWVEIHNETAYSISLGGYGLSDKPDKGIKWAFPNVTLQPDGYLVVFLSSKNRAPVSGELHASFGIKQGETIILYDAASENISSVELPFAEKNNSYALNSKGVYEVTALYSPGYPNTQAGHDALTAKRTAETSDVIINEIVPVNRTTVPDANGEYHDWMELYNKSAKDIDISGWAVSDKPERPLLWKFPQGTIIRAGECLVVYCSGLDKPAQGDYPAHTSFSISKDGCTITLTNNEGILMDSVLVQDVPTDRSYGRDALTGEWKVYAQPTPGLTNTDESAKAVQDQLFSRNGGLYIDKAVSRNAGLYETSDGLSDDFVEIVNRTGRAVNLMGYGLSDDVGRPLMWTFPDVTLENGQRLTVACSGNENLTNLASGQIHTLFRLGGEGEEIVLSTPERQIIDKIVLPPLKRNMAYGRIEGRSGLFYFTDAQPGSAETEGYERLAPEPEFSVPAGVYSAAQVLAVEVPEGVTVRYTTDGRLPTENSPRYEGPLQLSGNAVLRFQSFAQGALPSDVVTATYIIGENPALPVVSMVLDPDDMFSNERGIYAKGPGYDSKIPADQPHKGANYYKGWERAASYEFFSLGGQLEYSIVLGTKIHGSFSREREQKSFSINARSEYGQSRIQYNPFENRDYEQYKNFVLRSTAQDDNRARMRDAIFTSLAEGTGVAYQAAKPVALYINGEYWGHYNLRERVNHHMVANFEGITNSEVIDNINVLEANTTVNHGSNAGWKEILSFLENNKLTNADNLKWIDERVDIENFFNYTIMEMWSGNTDTGNIRFYQVPGGKWKWILYDLDWAFNRKSATAYGPERNSLELNTQTKGHGQGSAFSTLLIRRLLEVPSLREQFINQMAYLLNNNLSQKNVANAIDSMAEKMKPEMGRHYSRWPNQGSVSSWEKHIGYLHDYNNERNGYMISHMKSYFKLSDSRIAELFPER